MTDELAETTTESSGPAEDGAATATSEAVSASPIDPELTDPSLYFNRELSWLDFNDRVLQLAEDPRVPLLERVKFAAIYEDNLDEFYMVRVANLHDQVESKIDARGADGMAAADVIELIRRRVRICESDSPLLRGRDPPGVDGARDPDHLRWTMQTPAEREELERALQDPGVSRR